MGRLRLLYLCFIVGQVLLTPVYTTPGYFFFLGPISTRDNRVLKGHSVARYIRSLAPLTPLTRSTALRFAPQRSASLRSLRSLAPFTGSLTHSAHSLVGRLKFMKLCSR